MDSGVVMLIIGLAVFVWSFISKRRKKKRAAGKPGSRPDLISLITEKIRQSVAELEKRAGTAPQTGGDVREVPDPWASLAGDESPAQARGEAVRRTDDNIPEPERDVVEARAEAVVQEKPPAPEPPVPPVDTPLVSPPVPGRRKPEATPVYAGLSSGGLRNAVVWSEILAPPLALRKDDFLK